MYLVRLAQYALKEGPVTSLCLVVVAVALLVYNLRRMRMVQLIGKIPGPEALPIIGNCLQMNVDHDEIFERLAGSRKLWGRSLGFSKGWLGNKPYIFISKATALEEIIGSVKHIEKSSEYNYLHPWLGTGLLTSSGQKWQFRRKILTPAFHFRILDDFIDIFREQSDIFVEKLQKECGQGTFNIFPYVTLCALDIICETAMGHQVQAQSNSDSEYVRAVYEIGSIVQTRQAKLWLQPDWLFRMSSLHKRHQNCINILHSFSNKVITDRKAEISKNKSQGEQLFDEKEDLGGKKRLAFLDLLIEASQDGKVLSDEDIREEVDTFMFEGHDTTSAGISWLLFLLGWHPDIQDKVVAEIEAVFGGEDRPLTMKDLTSMKYLECCIKEALRLYPSVPIMARSLQEDIVIEGYTIPAGTVAMIITYMLHRDPEVFPHPERFNPDHFLAENCRGRHPYAFIPFSAGPRNCVGQKFALLEEKAVISTFLRKYRIVSVDRREDLTLLGELILRPKNGLRVKIFPRNRSS
ncbi:LOW QUALITY PROTEIN: cytochrome P450 4c3-like [Homalodisca vitripennis]|uniref:LOW QUALITY PROTEIN: cytochrome P450 4c3-like n=1 Tax=Homalodisca vitripennis TaxID=197043 RepID=UPI001EEA7640|nr:LOW QUALITY PROTEIN: cytochrome P450 4c3-like [Homalodisca vitripennis]